MAAKLQELIPQLQQIEKDEKPQIASAPSSAALEEIRLRTLGKKGRLSLLMREMGGLTGDDRPAAGKVANEVKDAVQAAIDARSEELKQAEMQTAIAGEAIDITLPGIRPTVGTLHPLTQVQREIEDIFGSMGFGIELGPEIEDDFHNFEALNFPNDHPARDMQDTFYLASELLLRTHTSPVQIHTIQSRKPPMAVIAPGKVYRCDDLDATHSPMFHQVEGFLVDMNVRFSDLKGILEAFIHRMFGPNTPYRLRPSFFPFTEPSAEVDIFFERRHPNGHMVREWMEILGSGMIHPKVLENCGVNPQDYTGFAFGMGVERVAMLKYGINAINLFYENDVRFLRQFR
jgi:phenylalanyl-tRNA synthetase alpha chain